jgi:hypothetical protein
MKTETETEKITLDKVIREVKRITNHHWYYKGMKIKDINAVALKIQRIMNRSTNMLDLEHATYQGLNNIMT